MAFHARPRATKDLDLLLEPTSENAERVLSAIRQFLGSDLGLKPDDLSTPGRIVQLGVAPSRIDLLAKIEGVEDFEAALKPFRAIIMWRLIELRDIPSSDEISSIE